LSVDGGRATGTRVRWQIAGADARAHNVPGRPRAVDVQRLDADGTGPLEVAPLGCAVFRMPLRQPVSIAAG